MAKQIIVLSQNSNGTTINYSFAFWFAITSGPATSGNSVWTGASAAENAAITSGTVKEEVQSFSFAIGTPAATIKSVVNQAWTERNSQINGIGPNQFYGVFFDSATGWSA